MTTTLVTLVGDVSDAIGTDFDPRRTKAHVRHNTAIVVTDDGFRLGSGTVNVNSDGTFELPDVVAATTLVENLQATVYIDYADPSTRQRATATLGPYDLTAETGTVDIRDLEEVQALDPSFASEFMDQAQALLDAQIELAGIDDVDSEFAALIDNPLLGPLTNEALDTAFLRQSHIGVDVLANGATGDGTTNDTAAIHAVRDAAAVFGAPLRFPAGTYAVTQVVNNVAGQQWLLEEGAVIKLADGAGDGTGFRCPVILSASNTRLIGGTVDGNRNGQDKTAFNAAGGSNGGRYLWGVRVAGSGTITGITVDTKIINAVDTALYGNDVTDSTFRARISDCGSAFNLSEIDNIELDITATDIDNDGWKVFPHAFDLTLATNIRGTLMLRGHAGDGSVAGGTALSNLVSGLTATDCSELALDLDLEATTAASQSPGVGASLLGVRRSNFTARIVAYSEVLLELGGVTDTNFYLVDLDQRFTLANANVLGRGIAAYNNAMRGDHVARTREWTRNVKFFGGQVRRCTGHAVDLWDSIDTEWFGVDLRSSGLGLHAKKTEVDAGASPAPASSYTLRGHKFYDCRFNYNGRSGVENYDMNDAAFINCEFQNNNQDTTYGSVRNAYGTTAVDSAASGYSARTSSNKSGVLFVNPRANDTQSTSAPGFPDPAGGLVIAVDKPELYGENQVIRLLGAGAAGANLLARINQIDHDLLTLSDPIVTVPTVSGTGTITTTGTAVVGSGTAFLTQLTGRAYIKVGSEYHRIAKVADNTHATLDDAFASNLTGSAFDIVQVTIEGVPSQYDGFTFTTDSLSPQIIGGATPAGNTHAAITDGTATATRLRMLGVSGQVSRLTNSLVSGGNLTANGDTGAESTVGTVGPSSQPAVRLHDTTLYRDNTNRLRTAGKITADLGLGVGNSAAATTPGSVVKKAEIFDASGASLGYIAIYSSIT